MTASSCFSIQISNFASGERNLGKEYCSRQFPPRLCEAYEYRLLLLKKYSRTDKWSFNSLTLLYIGVFMTGLPHTQCLAACICCRTCMLRGRRCSSMHIADMRRSSHGGVMGWENEEEINRVGTRQGHRSNIGTLVSRLWMYAFQMCGRVIPWVNPRRRRGCWRMTSHIMAPAGLENITRMSPKTMG